MRIVDDGLPPEAAPETAPDSAADIFARSGVAALMTESSVEDKVAAVKAFKSMLPRDAVEAGVLRAELTVRLKSIGFTGAGEFVKRVFAPADGNGHAPDSGIIFEEPEPWDSPVDGLRLADDVRAVFNRFIILPDRADTACSLWVMFAWAFDEFPIAPLLNITSPTKACGKSTLLDVLTKLVPRPLTTANISTAALFRSVEVFRPCLLVDEADTFLNANDEIGGVLNAAHTRTKAYVIRTVGDNHEVKRFSVWCPKVVAGIGRRKDTLESRSITIAMRRKVPGEKVEKLRLRDPDTADLFSFLRSRLKRWAEDNGEALRYSNPAIPDGLSDRAGDNWEPLLSIADLIGGEWPELTRHAAAVLSGKSDTDDEEIRVQLLAAIRDWFGQNDADRVSGEDLAKHLHGIEDGPWVEFGRSGKPISKSQIARLLKPFGVKSKNQKAGLRVYKGYALDDLEEIFSRYLPLPKRYPATGLNNNELEPKQNATGGCAVADEKRDNDLINQSGSAVADWEGGSGEKKEIPLFKEEL